MTFSTKKTAIYLGWADSEISSKVLRTVAEKFEVVHQGHYGFKESIDQPGLAKLRPDFLFSFGPVIVRRILLDAIQVAAINLHTAPPKWPGRGSVSFALFEGDNEFGVTAHLMREEVDSGEILKVLRFPISKDDGVESLHQKTLAKIPELAALVLDELEKNGWQVKPSGEKWARKALRQSDLLHLMEIEEGDPADRIERKIKAFAHSKKPGPFIQRHSHRFWYIRQSNPGAES